MGNYKRCVNISWYNTYRDYYNKFKMNIHEKLDKVVLKGENVYLRKARSGWRVVKPIKNEDGSINWFNLLAGGSWWNLLFVGVLVLLICISIWEYTHNINILLSCFDNPIALRECTMSFNPNLIIRP